MNLQSKENRNKNERQMDNWGNICNMSEKWLKSFIHQSILTNQCFKELKNGKDPEWTG